MPLPPFSFNNEVIAVTAKQDHIQVTLGGWFVTGTTEDIDALRDRMGAPPESIRNNSTEGALHPWGRLFKRPHQRGTTRSSLAVRREALQLGNAIIPPPLFSGKWSFGNYVNGTSENHPVPTRLQLHLNPTRYARYQPISPLPDSAPSAPWPEARLYAASGEAEVNGEVVLNSNDNWIPDSQRWAAFTNPRRWRRHLRTYLGAILAEFECELERAASLPECARWQRLSESLNLHSAETYWEFSSANPTAVVASLQPLLNSFTARSRETTTHHQDCDQSIDHNALSLSAEINPGRTIRIYAKTNRRVRVEVIHSFWKDKAYRMDGGHTAVNWHRLPYMLDWLADDAAALVNRMFTHFRNQNDLTSSQIAPYQLLLEICHYSRHLPTATVIAATLIHNGSIAAGGAGEKMQRALQRLSGARILEYSSQSRIYTVTVSRRYALEMLQRHGDFSLLVCRIRRRPNPSPDGAPEV